MAAYTDEDPKTQPGETQHYNQSGDCNGDIAGGTLIKHRSDSDANPSLAPSAMARNSKDLWRVGHKIKLLRDGRRAFWLNSSVNIFTQIAE